MRIGVRPAREGSGTLKLSAVEEPVAVITGTGPPPRAPPEERRMLPEQDHPPQRAPVRHHQVDGCPLPPHDARLRQPPRWRGVSLDDHANGVRGSVVAGNERCAPLTMGKQCPCQHSGAPVKCLRALLFRRYARLPSEDVVRRCADLAQHCADPARIGL